MVAYNFAHHMARAIIAGEKDRCIKPHGKRAHVAVGGTVTAFVGNVPPDFSKSPDCHRLLDAPCVRSVPVQINERGLFMDDRYQTNPEFLRLLAEAEGHRHFSDLQAKLHRMGPWPWTGQFLRWDWSAASFVAAWPLEPRGPPEGGDAPE